MAIASRSTAPIGNRKRRNAANRASPVALLPAHRLQFAGRLLLRYNTSAARAEGVVRTSQETTQLRAGRVLVPYTPVCADQTTGEDGHSLFTQPSLKTFHHSSGDADG